MCTLLFCIFWHHDENISFDFELHTIFYNLHLFLGLITGILNTFHFLFQKKQKIEPILYMTEWFLCVFTRTLPWDTILRIWDMFLCEGAVFRCAVVKTFNNNKISELVLLKILLTEAVMLSLVKSWCVYIWKVERSSKILFLKECSYLILTYLHFRNESSLLKIEFNFTVVFCIIGKSIHI